MKKILLALLLLSTPVLAQVNPDLCNGSRSASSVAINVAAAGTTQLVAASGNASIWVCSYAFSSTGATTSTTVQFTAGTGGTCAVATVLLTGSLAPNVATTPPVVMASSVGATAVLKVPAGSALCIVVAGTTPSVQGHVSFVQQ